MRIISPPQWSSDIPDERIPYTPFWSTIRMKDYTAIYESECIIPTYVVDRFLAENPGQKGYFCVYRPVNYYDVSREHLRLPPTYANGHLFEMTWWGTLKYHGNFCDEERRVLEDWKGKNWPVRQTQDPLVDELHYIKRRVIRSKPEVFMVTEGPPGGDPNYAPGHAQLKPFDGSNYFRKEMLEIHKFTMSEGSYRRLGKWPQKSYQKPTHNLCINLPKLVAQIIAMGLVEAKDVGKYMYPLSEQPEGLSYAVGLRNPFGEWQNKGWSYTERKGMDILVG